MPTSHVVAVCVQIATTEGNGCISQVTLQLNLPALMAHFRKMFKSWAFLRSAFLPRRYRIFRLRLSLQCHCFWVAKITLEGLSTWPHLGVHGHTSVIIVGS